MHTLGVPNTLVSSMNKDGLDMNLISPQFCY